MIGCRKRLASCSCWRGVGAEPSAVLQLRVHAARVHLESFRTGCNTSPQLQAKTGWVPNDATDNMAHYSFPLPTCQSARAAVRTHESDRRTRLHQPSLGRGLKNIFSKPKLPSDILSVVLRAETTLWVPDNARPWSTPRRTQPAASQHILAQQNQQDSNEKSDHVAALCSYRHASAVGTSRPLAGAINVATPTTTVADATCGHALSRKPVDHQQRLCGDA